jgi:hypothetical protein
MAMRDPDPGLDPLMLQHFRNAELRGYEHPGQQAEMLEREAQHQAAVPPAGGGVSVRFIQGDRLDPTSDPFNVNARREALNLPALDQTGEVRHVRLGHVAHNQDDPNTGEVA